MSCWRCIWRFKPRLVVIVFIVVTIFMLRRILRSYGDGGSVHIYTQTGSISERTLEVVVCSMPRLHPGRLMHKGEAIPAANNYMFFHEYVYPLFESSVHKYLKLCYNMTKCMIEDTREHRAEQRFPELLEHLATSGEQCWEQLNSTVDNETRSKFKPYLATLKDIFEVKMNEFLISHYEVLDERWVEEYDKAFENTWVLKYENTTLSEWLDFIAIDLLRSLNIDLLDESRRDYDAPLHQLSMTSMVSRIAPSCVHEVLMASSEHSQQTTRMLFPFFDNCSEIDELKRGGSFETNYTIWPKKSLCLETKNMYGSVYIAMRNSFTDVPMAGIVVPHRVPFDHQTRINVKLNYHRVANPTGRECHDYADADQSQVHCIEDCLFKRVLSRIDCMVPWLQRHMDRHIAVAKRSNESTEPTPKLHMVECSSSKELNHTMEVLQDVFDSTAPQGCDCRQECDIVELTSRVTGSIRSDEPYLELVLHNPVDDFDNEDIYTRIQLMVETADCVGFFGSITALGLYDWLIGALLWLVGLLPYVPAMPPLILHNMYASECDCRDGSGSEADNSDSDDSDIGLTRLFHAGQNRRTAVMELFRHEPDTDQKPKPESPVSSSSSLASIGSLKRRFFQFLGNVGARRKKGGTGKDAEERSGGDQKKQA